MITAEFDYEAPASLDRLLEVLRRDAESTKLLAGGMTLVPMLNLGLLSPDLLVGLRNIPDLSGVTEQPDCILVGADGSRASGGSWVLTYEYGTGAASGSWLVPLSGEPPASVELVGPSGTVWSKAQF